jgi:uncharacterized membrane protein YebE (DUF533 family)
MTKKKRNTWMLIAAAGGLGYLIYRSSMKQKAAAALTAATSQGDYLYIGGPK